MNMDAYAGYYGTGNNYSAIPAGMLNSGAYGDDDFGTVLANGIKNAAANAIYQTIGGAYASGQLQPPPVAYTSAPPAQGSTLLIAGLVLFFLLSGKAGG